MVQVLDFLQCREGVQLVFLNLVHSTLKSHFLQEMKSIFALEFLGTIIAGNGNLRANIGLLPVSRTLS